MTHLAYRALMSGDSNSASGAFMAGQRTVIDRPMFERLINALLDVDDDAPDKRIAAAAELVATAPSWWSGGTAHRDRLRQGAAE